MIKKILWFIFFIKSCEVSSLPKRIKLSAENDSTEQKKIFIHKKSNPASFFCVLHDLSDLFLHIDNGVLEKLDFEQALSTHLKEQLIIYDLFSKFFLLLEYKENQDFRKKINNIARSFNINVG